MGNKDSRNKGDYAVMHIELNKQHFESGESIQGSIHMQVNKQYPAKVVFLQIEGIESTKWVSNEGKGTKRHKSKHTGKNIIMLTRSII
jgi:hypothetical protein